MTNDSITNFLCKHLSLNLGNINNISKISSDRTTTTYSSYLVLHLIYIRKAIAALFFIIPYRHPILGNCPKLEVDNKQRERDRVEMILLFLQKIITQEFLGFLHPTPKSEIQYIPRLGFISYDHVRN